MLAFGEEKFLDALAMTGPEAFFNKLLDVKGYPFNFSPTGFGYL